MNFMKAKHRVSILCLLFVLYIVPSTAAVTVTHFDQCHLEVTNITGSTVSLEFKSLPANRPQQYNNFIAIWEGTSVPWGTEPLKKKIISTDAPDGSIAMDEIQIQDKPYILVYGMGSDLGSICATALVHESNKLKNQAQKDLNLTQHVSITISIVSLSSDSLVVFYQTPRGYLPAHYKNRISIWEGEASPYNAPKPIQSKEIDQDYSMGTVALNTLGLKRNTTYTLVYFTGESQTSAACILIFKTDDK
jgi:hypothetical protein